MKSQNNDSVERRVLFTTIAEYVSSGKAVSSATLSKSYISELSPATIRRKMQELTEQGFLVQEHSSAGRIPTDAAFRLFVDELGIRGGQLDDGKRSRLIQGLKKIVPGGTGAWSDVVRVLSDVSFQASLVITPTFSDAVLRQLRFISCGGNSLLAVVITRDGLVNNAYVASLAPLTEQELERIHNYLNDLIEGKSLNSVRKLLREQLEDARRAHDALREQATLLGTKAIESSVERSSDLVVDGRTHLMSQVDSKAKMEDLMQVLEEKSLLLDLLDKAASKDQGPIVIIGEEGGKNFSGCSIITHPFGGEGTEGQVGIIGSTRMDYTRLLPLVALSAQFLSTLFSREDD